MIINNYLCISYIFMLYNYANYDNQLNRMHSIQTLPDSERQMLCGEPFSRTVTRSFLRALRSTNTVVGSGLEAPWDLDGGRVDVGEWV